MKKRIIGSVLMFACVMIMAGCGNKIPELSDQQQDLVVEYASSVLLKYDANHASKLVELTLEQEAQEEVGTEEVSQTPDGVEEEKKPEEAGGILEGDMSDVTVIDQTQAATIESFLKLDSVKITYTGYETAAFYPDQGDDLFFVMNASEGNQLLVLKFLAENLAGTETGIDIAQKETRFKIVVDGQEKNALTTMLLNDMAYYQGTIAPGESAELVLICEIPTGQEGTISSLELVMKNAEDAVTIPLN